MLQYNDILFIVLLTHFIYFLFSFHIQKHFVSCAAWKIASVDTFFRFKTIYSDNNDVYWANDTNFCFDLWFFNTFLYNYWYFYWFEMFLKVWNIYFNKSLTSKSHYKIYWFSKLLCLVFQIRRKRDESSNILPIYTF